MKFQVRRSFDSETVLSPGAALLRVPPPIFPHDSNNYFIGANCSLKQTSPETKEKYEMLFWRYLFSLSKIKLLKYFTFINN